MPSQRSELPLSRLIDWLGISRPKFYDWLARYGKVNEHNALIPRDHWLLPEEKQAFLDYHARFPLEGYRRLRFMMLDADLVACSPSSVYRVLAGAGLLDRYIWYLNLGGTFYYLCSILDEASRVIVHFDIRERMTELDVLSPAGSRTSAVTAG